MRTWLPKIDFFDAAEIAILIFTDLTAVFATIGAQIGKNHTVSFHCTFSIIANLNYTIIHREHEVLCCCDLVPRV